MASNITVMATGSAVRQTIDSELCKKTARVTEGGLSGGPGCVIMPAIQQKLNATQKSDDASPDDEH